MTTLATLLVKVGVDAQDVDTGVSKAERSLSGFTSRVNDAGKSMQHVGGLATLGLTVPLIGLGNAAVNSAKSLNESMNAIEVVFGSAVGKIQDFGKTSAQTVGLSTRAFNELVTPVGAALLNVGFSQDQAADSSINLARRAADMASVFNTDVSTAMEAIQAGLRGEADPLERFGIGLSDAAVTAKAMELGLAGSTSEIDAQDKATARLALIMQQSDRYAGDFANTSGELANQERIAAAEAENQAAVFGRKLIPIKERLIRVAQSLLDWFTGLSEGQQDLIVKAGLLAAALGPVLLALGTMARGLSSIITLGVQVGSGMISIGRGIAGFFGPGGGFDTVRLSLMYVGEAVGSVISRFASMAVSAATTAAQVVAAVAQQLAAWALMGVQALIHAAQVAAAWLISIGPIALVVAAIAAAVFLVIKYWDEIKEAIMAAVHFVIDFVSDNWPLILAILTGPIGLAVLFIYENWQRIVDATWWFISTIAGYFGMLGGWIMDALSWIIGGIAGIFQWAIQGAINVVSWGVNTIVWLFSSVPWMIWNALVGLGQLLWDVFRGAVNSVIGAFNWLIDIWNDLRFPEVSVGPVHFGGWDLPNIGHIPYLAAGAIVKRPTLAVVGEGPEPEAVMPLSHLDDLMSSGEVAVPPPAEPLARVVFDFRGADEALGRALKRMVRVEGRGDAQVAFGG